MMLGLPVVSSLYKGVRRSLPEQRIESVKDHLLKRNDDNETTQPLIFPTTTQLNVLSPEALVTNAKAHRLLGYTPAFDLEKGIERTEAWARWARLLD